MKKQLFTASLALLFLTDLSALKDEIKPSDRTPPAEEKSWIMINSFGTGYRRDRQRLIEPTYEAYLDNFNTVTMNYEMEFAWERLRLKLYADYGWLINGTLSYKGLLIPFSAPSQVFPRFNIASGYSVNVKPSLACGIQFWKIACGQGVFSFTPELGYAYTHFNAFPRGRKLSTPAGSTGFTALEFTRPIQQDWYGPFAKGAVGFTWKEQWRFDIFYQYTHVNFRQTFTQIISNFYPTVVNTTSMRISSKGTTMRTQMGGADLSYRFPRHWQVGTHFEGSATWSQTNHSIVRLIRDFFVPAASPTQSSSREKLNAHWTTYLANLYASYWF